MELSSVTLRVLLLFFPGVVCAMFLDALTVHRERTPVEFLTHSFALGMGSYLALATTRDLAAAAAQTLHLREPLDVTFFDALLNDRVQIAWREIVVATFVGIVVAYVTAALLNRHVIERVGKALGATRKSGALDVWGYLFNAAQADYIVVRDQAVDLAYVGQIEMFSSSVREAELLLKDVEVFRNSTSMKLYDAERVYLAREVNNLVIEPLATRSSYRNPDAA